MRRKLVVNIAVASTRASAKYTPYIAHLIFYPSFLTSSLLGRHQNSSQQRTVARTRQPSPELDDDRSNNQLANTTDDSIN